MDFMPLKLEDLVPKQSQFQLSGMPGKTLTLCKWSLRVRVHALAKYTSGGLEMIFRRQQIQEISELAFFMLVEKDLFPGNKEMTPLEHFQDCISTTQDNIAVITAMLETIGIGEPEIEEINKALEAKKKADITDPNEVGPEAKTAPKKKTKTGAKSLTP